MVTREQLVSGIGEYLQKEIFTRLDSKREFLAGMAYGVVSLKIDKILSNLEHSPINSALELIQGDNIDIETIYQVANKQIAAQGRLEISIPLIGNFAFNSADIDNLYKCIMNNAAPTPKPIEGEAHGYTGPA